MTETIAVRLRRLRLERDLSQRQLAVPGVTYAYISRLEAGTRVASVKALRKLAARLGVTPLFLEQGTDNVACPHCLRPAPSTDPRTGERGATENGSHHP